MMYAIVMTYNIEAESAVKALDSVIGKHPLTPIAFNCEPIEPEHECEFD